LFSISVVVFIIKITFGSLGSETVGGGFEFLLVFVSSSDLVVKGTSDFSEFNSVLSKSFSGISSHLTNFVHKSIEVNLGVNFSLHIIFHESGEGDLKFRKEVDAFGKGVSIKSRSDLDESGNWVGSTKFGEFSEDLGWGVWVDVLHLWYDNF